MYHPRTLLDELQRDHATEHRTVSRRSWCSKIRPSA